MSQDPTVDNGSDATPALSRRKQLIFWLVLIGFVWLIADTTAYIGLRLKPYWFFSFQAPTDAMLDRFYEERFDARWGWDLRYPDNRGRWGERISREYPEDATFLIKTFGDSFTQGAGENHETYQYYAEELTGWNVLNFGVGAFGTDQALLKYLDNDVPSKYTVLTILDENIARIVMSTWAFYVQGGFETKPRFVRGVDGQYTLRPNPTRDYADLQRLKDRDFVLPLVQDDYWFQYRMRTSIFGRPSWPATVVALRNWRFFTGVLSRRAERAQQSLFERRATSAGVNVAGGLPYAQLYHDEEAMALMRFLVDEFIRTATERGEIPIVIVFPTLSTLDIIAEFDRAPYEPLLEHLDQTGVHYMDFGAILATEEDHARLYDGVQLHYGVVGNQRVAEEIVSFVQTLEGSSDSNN